MQFMLPFWDMILELKEHMFLYIVINSILFILIFFSCYVT